jgi:hypothetical protein
MRPRKLVLGEAVGGRRSRRDLFPRFDAARFLIGPGRRIVAASPRHVAPHVSPGLTEALGQSVVVENRTGAGGSVGAEFVARSRPDDYTLLWGAGGADGEHPALLRQPRYDLQKNFAPVGPVSLMPSGRRA